MTDGEGWTTKAESLMTFLRVRNFEKFQHYKHRSPPWIRLYKELLSDRHFYKLSGVLKFQIVGMFLLASQCDNKILADAEWIQTRIHSVEPIDIELLMATGFIEERKQRASKSLASCTQHAIPETETDNSETETDPPKPPAGVFVVTEEHFDPVWEEYPNRDGRKAALRHFLASVHTPDDLDGIRKALVNYKQQRDRENRRRREHGVSEIAWKNGSTWFNNWQDWIPEDQEQPDDEQHVHQCGMCEIAHPWKCENEADCTLSVEASCPEFRIQHKERMAVKA